jgi:hypothetical protein
MRAGGVVCCLWFGLSCSLLYGQHLPKAAVRGFDAGSQPAALGEFHPAEIAPVVNVSALTPSLQPFLVTHGFPGETTLEGVTQPQSPQIACTELVALKVNRAVSSNAFDHLDFSAAAIRSAFTHENLVKMGRNFVPGQPLPDAPTYVPLTTQQKFDRFLRYSHSGGFAFDVLSDSLYSQATGAYPRFGGGMEGYGKRLGASVAGSEAGAFFSGFLFPTLLHQDPRYFPSRQYDISDRMAYAASRVIVGRSDSGRNVFNSSLILSVFVQSALSNAYIPYRNETVPGTIENALANLGGIAEWNILTEFWPDIKDFLGKHHPKLPHHEQQKPGNDVNQVAEK